MSILARPLASINRENISHMKYTSEYLKLDFKKKIIPQYILALTLVGPLLSMFGYGFYQLIKNDTGSEYTSKIENLASIFNTIRNCTAQQLILLIFIGILISVILTFIFYKMNEFKKLIVSIEFNNETKQIISISRSITRSILQKESFNYRDITIIDDQLIYDYIGRRPYSGIEIKIKDRHIGYILKNHFTWNDSDFENIKNTLNKTKANNT